MSGAVKLNQVLLGDNADPTKNFIISVPAVPDGTLTIARGSGEVVIKVEATGKVTFPFGVTP